jgi:hypothetical protein
LTKDRCQTRELFLAIFVLDLRGRDVNQMADAELRGHTVWAVRASAEAEHWEGFVGERRRSVKSGGGVDGYRHRRRLAPKN